jgi:hypothetical protein
MPPETDENAAVQPVDYPGEPPEPITDESAITYLERFEAAYRRNAEIQNAETLVQYSGGVTDTRTYDAPPDAAVVRFRTVYSGTLESGAHYDSPNVYVSYYLDPTTVVRAERAGEAGVDRDALDPDPFESGRVVACFP